MSSLFGGFLTATNLALSALLLWTIAFPDMVTNGSVLLIAGTAVSAGFMRILPRWLVISGIVLAAFGEGSTLSLVFPKLLPLIPLTRFPGFIWLIIVGFKLPRSQPAAH